MLISEQCNAVSKTMDLKTHYQATSRSTIYIIYIKSEYMCVYVHQCACVPIICSASFEAGTNIGYVASPKKQQNHSFA